MAHFAELIQKTDPTGFTSDLHWVVERVIVVDNKHVSADEALDGETGVLHFLVVALGNKLLTIVILENNTLVKVIFSIQLKINF